LNRALTPPRTTRLLDLNHLATLLQLIIHIWFVALDAVTSSRIPRQLLAHRCRRARCSQSTRQPLKRRLNPLLCPLWTLRLLPLPRRFLLHPHVI
jgi:hypothetical protein